MFGLASKFNARRSARRMRSDRGAGLAWSHVEHTGWTPRTCAERALVSPVSPVSPNLKLIERLRNERWGTAGRALIGATPSALRQVGPVQQSCGFQGETTGVGHT